MCVLMLRFVVALVDDCYRNGCGFDIVCVVFVEVVVVFGDLCVACCVLCVFVVGSSLCSVFVDIVVRCR